ncbi:hypothetical protein TSAR_000785 [Trichomalopsis sarcophagae]|uniref:Uncharacterized protein n=1 Tax=Trichomalopsis sarcophagae TaxID=543379 RepID=A0A232FM64_9HYME|nr:hypothetical protein TSAR_000785 [Trichomalopsis sarcophagae]
MKVDTTRQPPVYTLEDLESEKIDGYFHEQQLTPRTLLIALPHNSPKISVCSAIGASVSPKFKYLLPFNRSMKEESEGVVCITRNPTRATYTNNKLRNDDDGDDDDDDYRKTFSQIKCGVYDSLHTLLSEINNLDNVKDHLVFEI